MINENEIIEKFDCTPTWSALLEPMLDLVAQGHGTKIKPDFKQMAKAADLWNQHCKSQKEAIKAAKLKELKDNYDMGLLTVAEYEEQHKKITDGNSTN